jgi:cephalosporin-C deacetylase-like acetyl esterase
MNSRREFLEATALAPLIAKPGLTARQTQTTPTTPPLKRDYWNDLPNRMIANVNAARARRKSDLAKITSPAVSDERISTVRARVWELIGGKPDESPLRAKTVGALERASYRIEKVIFESQPEFYVTAHLYLPKSGNGPFPGVLAPLGHTPDGKNYRSYQTVFQNLARKGFAVFTWDPPGQGERLQYIDPGTNHSRYGPTGEHDRFGWPALLIGSSTTQFEVWDGIRALDYLLSRSEIDHERIGCCGHSGGGTQTMFLCALESRIKVAVVVEGHTENLAGADYEPPGAYADAEQNLIGGLKIALDRGDLLGAFAPKPLRICYTPIDNGTTYSPHYVRGTEEIFDELKSIYGLYDATDRVALFSSTLPHDYDYFQRKATYEWFNKWLLNGRGDEEEAAFESTLESALWCTSTGQVLTSLGGRSAFQVNRDRLRTIEARVKKERLDPNQFQTGLRKILSLPAESTALNAISLSDKTFDSIAIEEFEYQSEPGIRVPGWFLKPSAAKSGLPVVLRTQDHGKDELFDQWPLIEGLAHAGIAICSIDLRTLGVTRPRLPSAGPLFYGYGVELAYALVNLSLGSPIVGQQTWDVLRCLDYLEGRADVDHTRIGVFGTGTSGLACAAGAALDQRACALMLNRTLVSLASVVAAKDYTLPLSAVAFGMLPGFDLPELCAAMVPRRVWLVNIVGPGGNGIPLSETNESYEVAARAYANANQAEKLAFRVESDPIDKVVLQWARQALVRS